MEQLLIWLRTKQGEIADLAQQARHELEQDNKDQYLALLRDRAELIADLAEQAEKFYQDVPDPVRNKAAKALHRFSRGAQFSLELDSPFYMSALLYPDQHQAGEPDNLELFIEDLAKLGRV